MRGHAKPDNQLSTEAARTQLSLMLAGATDDRLVQFTAPELFRLFRVPLREIEARLLDAQQKRKREIADRG